MLLPAMNITMRLLGWLAWPVVNHSMHVVNIAFLDAAVAQQNVAADALSRHPCIDRQGFQGLLEPIHIMKCYRVLIIVIIYRCSSHAR